jgi:DNA-binding NarL/FixJ family response regulator
VSAQNMILRLSARRRQCAEMVAEGWTNKEIAAAMGISEKSVANYLYAVYNATGCDNRTQLALLMVSAFPPPQPEPQRAEPTSTRKARIA